MKSIVKIAFLYFWLLSSISISVAQQGINKSLPLKDQFQLIRELTNTQEYSEALRQLKLLEDNEEIKSSLSLELDYRLLIARVLRLSYEFDDAMHQLQLLPNLDDHEELKIKYNFRKAALYMENPKNSMERRIKVVYPIVDEGIAVSKKIVDTFYIASFKNLKAWMYNAECDSLRFNCTKNREMAADLFKESMSLFLALGDTLNYHNVLNNLYRLKLKTKSSDLDSLTSIIKEFTKESTYYPNILASRKLLSMYYLDYKEDSINYLRQTVFERLAMIEAVRKDGENAISKLKDLYEFDSLKEDLENNRQIVIQKDLDIELKNSRIIQNIFYSIILGGFILVLIALFLKQKKLAQKMNVANLALNKSNDNYQLLIKESNHRIKNNLQMIMSIIELDKDEYNKEDKHLLEDISSKILTIAALHRILNFEEHNQRVKLKVYFNEIIQYYKDLFQGKVMFSVDFANPKVRSERIIYFGLILNEMISNTLKHRKGWGNIAVSVSKLDEYFMFVYKDDSDFDIYNKSNGINLIEDLIVRFGGFDLKFNPKQGEYKFYFYE